MATLYDKSGNPVEVPEADVPDKLASGEFGVPKDQAQHVFDPSGQLGTVPGDKLHDALKAGYQLASADDVARAKRAEEYGGVGGGLAAAGLEGLSTATLGLSDVAGSAIGGEGYKEARKGYREENPKSTLAGGLIGAVAPIALSGGAAAPEEAAALGGARLLSEGAEVAEAGKGLLGGAGTVAKTAGKVLGAPAAGASRAGSAVERMVGAALGADESTSLVTGLTKRAIAKGAGAATEASIFGVGQQLGEDALGDPDANGEKLYASGLHGALLGLGAGVGLSALGEVGTAVLGRASTTLSGMAEKQAVRAVNLRKAFVKELERLPGGAEAAGRQILDDGVLKAGDTVETLAPRVSAARTAAGEKVTGILETADKAGLEGPRLAELRQQIQTEVLDPLLKIPKTNAGAIAKVRGILDDLESFAGVPGEQAAARVHAPPVDEAAASRELNRIGGEEYELRQVPISAVTDNREVWSQEKLADAKTKLASGSPMLDPDLFAQAKQMEVLKGSVPGMAQLQRELKIGYARAAQLREALSSGEGALPSQLERVGGDKMPPIRLAEHYEGEGYTVADGIHRLNAAEAAGFTHIPAIVEKTAPRFGEQGAGAIDRSVLLDNAKLTFRQAQDFRGTIGKSIEWRVSPLGPVDKANEAAKDVYRLIEKNVEQTGERAAKEMGGSFLDEYKQAKLAYQRYTVLDKAAQDALAARTANRIVSPSDYGVGSAVAAGAIAHAAAGPVGAILAGAKGLAASMLHHEVRERGNSAAAVLLDKLSALRGVERAAKAVDREMDRGIAGILKEPGRAPPRVRELPQENHPYRAHAEAAIRASSDIEAHGQQVAAAAAPLAPHAPRTANAFQSVAVRAAQYLAAQAPHRRGQTTIMPHLDEPRISQTDEKKYLLVAHAVHDPVSVLHDMGQGRATRAQIDALKTVYPKLYGELVQRLQERLADRTQPLAYEQRKQLALLFGAAADPAAAPAFVARMQKDFAPAAGPGGGPSGAPRGGAPKRKLSGQSDSLRLPGS